MGLIVIATLSLFLSILLIPSASLHTQQQSSHSQATDRPLDVLPLVPPRKFRLLEEARVSIKNKSDGLSVSKPNNKQKRNTSGDGEPHQRQQNEMHAGGAGSGRPEREWVAVADKSLRFFTMDYAHVRRRRPVHNMSLQRP